MKQILIYICLLIFINESFSQISLGYKRCGIGIGDMFLLKKDTLHYNGIVLTPFIISKKENVEIRGVNINILGLSNFNNKRIFCCGSSRKGVITKGVSINAISHDNHSTHGVSISLINIPSSYEFTPPKEEYGLSISLIQFGFIRNKGVDISLINSDRCWYCVSDSYGLTISLLHLLKGSLINGLSIGILNNYRYIRNSGQIGILNLSEKTKEKAYQIGLINLMRANNETKYFQIGLINYNPIAEGAKLKFFFSRSKKNIK